MQFIQLTRNSESIAVTAMGDWTAETAAGIETAIEAAFVNLALEVPVRVDATGVTSLDTFGAHLLGEIERRVEHAGQEVSLSGLSSRAAALKSAVSNVEKVSTTKLEKKLGWSDRVADLGQRVTAVGNDALGLVEMLGQVGVALAHAVANPRTFRLTSTLHQIDRVALQAVPIIVLITFLIGCIIAQQGFFHFRKFGADQYVVDMTGILVVREIGVLLVAIMVAGRSGSSCTAELGSMKMREEIDAVRTMGLDPTSVLVLPRVIALVLSLPALTLIGILSALYGAGLVAWFYGDMNPDIFLARLREVITFDHLKVGLWKSPFMALMIGIVACREGLAVAGSAESLGLKTTASVVKAIFLVIVIDGLFAMYFAAIGL